MKKAAVWLFLLMVVSYGIAWTAVKDLGIPFFDIDYIREIEKNDAFLIGDNQSFSQKETVSATGIKQLIIGFVDADVTLITGDRETFLVEIKGDYASNFEHKQPRLEIQKQGDVLNIRIEDAGKEQGIYHDRKNVIVTIPNTYTDDVAAESVSGRISIQGGRYNLLKIGTVSGEIELKEVESDSMLVESTSGDISLGGCSGQLEAGSISGNVSVWQDALQDDMAIDTVSGNVEVHLESSDKVIFESKTTSGELTLGNHLKSKSANQKFEGNLLKINTVSGNIYVP